METDYDFSRLEANLYTQLLDVFESRTGLPADPSLDPNPAWFEHVSSTLEDLAICWLKGGRGRTLETLVEHIWPILCDFGTLEGDDAVWYEENDDQAHEVLGLKDAHDVEPEASMILMGMVSCAKALAATDSYEANFYAFHAERCAGTVVGAEWLRGDGRDWEAIRDRLAHAGRMSGIARRGQAKASPQQVQELEARLLQEGKGPRDTAAIIAKRLGVTPEYIRQLRRKPN